MDRARLCVFRTFEASCRNRRRAIPEELDPGVRCVRGWSSSRSRARHRSTPRHARTLAPIQPPRVRSCNCKTPARQETCQSSRPLISDLRYLPLATAEMDHMPGACSSSLPRNHGRRSAPRRCSPVMGYQIATLGSVFSTNSTSAGNPSLVLWAAVSLEAPLLHTECFRTPRWASSASRQQRGLSPSLNRWLKAPAAAAGR